MKCINCGQTEGEVYQGAPHDHVCADCGRECPYPEECPKCESKHCVCGARYDDTTGGY